MQVVSLNCQPICYGEGTPEAIGEEADWTYDLM